MYEDSVLVLILLAQFLAFAVGLNTREKALLISSAAALAVLQVRKTLILAGASPAHRRKNLRESDNTNQKDEG